MAATLLDDLAVAEWSVWTTTARLVVTRPDVLGRAQEETKTYLDALDRAASRFRGDSEVQGLAGARGQARIVSPLLADIVAAALDAAARTGGLVDPTLGAQLSLLGYDRNLVDLGDLGDGGDLDDRTDPGDPFDTVEPGAAVRLTRRASWRDVELDGRRLRVPAGVLLDLGAVAKAFAADALAVRLAEDLDCGVMVSLGGDLRVAGPAPELGWGVLVQDGPDEPASHVRLSGLDAMATSSTLHRTWRRGGRQLHHLLDPVSGAPVAPLWRTVSVAAPTCVEANTLTTGAIVAGAGALDLVQAAGLPARLVDAAGDVLRVGGWPA